MNTTENNILIAEFMGARIEEENNRFIVYNWDNKNYRPLKVIQSTPFSWNETKENTLDNIYKNLVNPNYGSWGKFHSSWDWLMPVVEKIEGIGFTINITTCTVYINNFEDSFKQIIGTSDSYSKIEAVYNAVIEFIKFYNDK